MTSNEIGKALAGHAARGGDTDNPRLAAKAKNYSNGLTDLVLAVIAMQRLKIDTQNDKE